MKSKRIIVYRESVASSSWDKHTTGSRWKLSTKKSPKWSRSSSRQLICWWFRHNCLKPFFSIRTLSFVKDWSARTLTSSCWRTLKDSNFWIKLMSKPSISWPNMCQILEADSRMLETWTWSICIPPSPIWRRIEPKVCTSGSGKRCQRRTYSRLRALGFIL